MSSERLVSLDTVRGLAALAVAIPHFFLFRGYESAALEFIAIMAVEVFFVLSGLVLAPQLLRCVETGMMREVRTFYYRRWMRTLPPYAFVLLAMAIITGNLFSFDIPLYALFVRNFASIRSTNDFFVVAWSLAIEEWFYLVFPVFLVVVTQRRNAVIAGVAFLGLFLVVKLIYAALYPDLFSEGRRIVILRVDAIAVGFLLSFVLMQLAKDRRALLIAIAPLAAVTLALSIYGMRSKNVLLFVYAAPCFAACVITLLTSAERLLQNRIAAGLASFFAKTSYMIYLVHTLIVIILARVEGVAEAYLFAAYLVVLLGFCWVFHLAVEAPILRARPRYRGGHHHVLTKG